MPRRSYTSRRARRSFRSRRNTYRNRALRIRTVPRRRSSRYQKYATIGRTLGAFPNRKTVALRYVQDLTLDATSTSSAVNVFRANSINDPDYTGVGHQPMFSDLYAQIYEKYKVNYATIRVVALSTHVVNTTHADTLGGNTIGAVQYYAANERACRLWILKDASVNDYPANLDTLIEEGSKNFRWRYCPQSTNGRLPSVKMSCAPHKLLGLSRNDNTLNSLVNNNPDAAAYFIVGCEGLGGDFNPDSMQFQVIITYNVTFYELKKNQSQN